MKRLFNPALLVFCMLSTTAVVANALMDSIPLEVDGYAMAPEGRAVGSAWPFEFPEDHLAHDNYRSELWQVYLRLTDEQGTVYGLTGRMARIGIMSPDGGMTQDVNAGWAFNRVYVSAHGLSKFGARDSSKRDLDAAPVFNYSRSLSRGALGLAGYRDAPPRLWNHHQQWYWQNMSGCDLQLGLDVTVSGSPLALTANAGQCPVVNNVSDLPSLWGYWQSIDDVSGEIGNDRIVSGSGWLERAWGELPIGRGPVLVDQFRLSLGSVSEDNPVSIHLLRSRRRDGSGKSQLSAYAYLDGSRVEIPVTSLSLTDRSFWKSPVTGERYSSGWEMNLPDVFNQSSTEPLQVRLEPHVQDQEIDLYGETRWSGLVNVISTGSKAVTGFAFVDLEPVVNPGTSESAE